MGLDNTKQTTMHYEKADGFFNFVGFYEAVAQALSDGAIIAEVGVYKGKSALFLAEKLLQMGKRVDFHLIDHFEGSEEHDITPEQLWQEFNANIEPLKHHFHVHRMDSIKASMMFADGTLDFVFIDASHDYESVKNDIIAWLPKVKKGGVLAGHDYHHPPVRHAVNDVLYDVTEYYGTCWGVTV